MKTVLVLLALAEPAMAGPAASSYREDCYIPPSGPSPAQLSLIKELCEGYDRCVVSWDTDTGEVQIERSQPSGKAVVHWRDKDSGVTGHGAELDMPTANIWLEEMLQDHPEMEHWLEPVPPQVGGQ